MERFFFFFIFYSEGGSLGHRAVAHASVLGSEY